MDGRFKWDAHVCLPISVDTDVRDLLAYQRAGVDFISLNIGMCMNPLSQIEPVIAHFTAAIAATPGLALVGSVDDLEPGVVATLVTHAVGSDRLLASRAATESRRGDRIVRPSPALAGTCDLALLNTHGGLSDFAVCGQPRNWARSMTL